LKKLFILICFFIPLLLAAQEFNYIHYDTKDGLAGSTVYSMYQDKDGFIWFATENGLSRYDGTHFKSFTVKDDLPDNEVLKVFADSKGRIWVGTFSKEICFYYKGKIHTKKNDSLVKKINLDASISCILESADHFLGITDDYAITIITPNDSVLKYNINRLYTKKFMYGNALVNHYGRLVLHNDQFEALRFNTISFNWEKFFLPKMSFRTDVKTKFDSFLIQVKYDSSVVMSFPGKIISTSKEGTFYAYINTTKGVWDIDTITLKRHNHYLPERKISWTAEDKEKNIWFSSLGNGVYKLSSSAIKTLLLSGNKKNNVKEVFSIIKYKDAILTGLEANQAKVVDDDFRIKEFNYKSHEINAGFQLGDNRLYSMVNISNSITILGFDKFLVKLENDKSHINYISPIKSVEKINNDFIIVGTNAYAFKMRLKDLQITDTLWRERCTKVFYHNNNYYIGTLKGLYQVKEDKSYTYLGNLYTALTRRITDIKSSTNGTLWVATADNGIVAFKEGKIIKAITDSNGLSSNICKTLFIKDDFLWAGTDKGISKINISSGQYNIIKYSTSDGLPSNTINAIYVKDSTVWVGSPAGLTYFNENNISSSSICNLQMLGIYVSGKQLAADSSFHLTYQNNNVNFEYAGISFRSGGEIVYHYKLTGLDNDWKTTTENNLDYKSLPAGDYTLQLYAVNKYGVQSNSITIKFSVAAPFWKTLWFYLLLAAIAFTGIILLFNWRNKKTKQRLEEKNNFQKQFAALEQQALQSQMNPHFIFNCLNSIQQYIFTNEKEKANLYLTDFSSLIRQTLDISSQQTITVAEEASYLKKYLDMERMRFGESFSYTITTYDSVNAAEIQMPALLLQPYVENSLRHGIRYKEEGGGKVDISFSVKHNNLYCTIKDNGVGRDKAATFKGNQHIEYQSKGMSLTGKRIELLNAINETKIAVTITDLKNNDNTAAGTLVQINIPI
jgi:Histidine kinase/Y_Y_Y domain/Two component regulator propeller